MTQRRQSPRSGARSDVGYGDEYGTTSPAAALGRWHTAAGDEQPLDQLLEAGRPRAIRPVPPGRSRRAEFWWYFLANLIISVVLNILVGIASIFIVLYVIYSLAVLIPGLAVGIRRLHDTDRSGWWLLIALIPIVGIIVLIVFWATDGQPAPNQYGASEKYAGVVRSTAGAVFVWMTCDPTTAKEQARSVP